MPRFRSPLHWLVAALTLAAALSCGGGDSLTVPSEGLPAKMDKLGGDNQSGVVVQPLPDTLAVRVTDARDRAVVGQAVVFSRLAGGAQGAVIPDTASTDLDGIARSVWVLGQLAGPQRVEARVVATGQPGTVKATFDATGLAAAADTIRLLAGDRQTATVGGLLPDSLVALVTDRYGNPVAGTAVQWSTGPGQGSVSAASVPTGADGRSAVTRTLGDTAGTQVAFATVAGLKGSPVSFTAVATAGGAASLVKVSGDQQTAPAGFALTDSIVVQVRDANGNGIAGRNVNWVVTSGGGNVAPLTSVTDALGFAWTRWTLGPTAGSNTVTAAAAGLPQVAFTATGGAAQPTKLLAQSTLTQSGTVGQAVGAPPSVKVTDQNNNPVQGVTVTFTVTGGGGTVSDGSSSGASASVTTSAQGVATLANWTLGTTTGANSVSAAANGAGGSPLSGSPIGFSATAAAGAAARVVITTEPSATAQSGVVLGTQPVVALRDAFGNPVTQSGVSIASASGAAGAALRGTLSATTNASGVATFTGLNLFGTAGGYPLVFTSGALVPDTSVTIALTAGPKALLAVTTQPSASAQSGSAFAQQPVVQVRDSAGNNVAAAGEVVTAAIATGGGQLKGTLTATTGSTGAAAFTNLSISGSAGTRTLVFSASGLASVTSGPITLGAGTPTQLALTTQPSGTAQSGVAFAQQPVAQLQDASGNPVALAGVDITVTITGAPGGVTLGGTQTVQTGSGGSASFTGLSLTGPTASYTLDFTVTAGVTGVTSVTSSAIALGAGSGTVLSLDVAPPATARSGVALTPAPVLQLRDGVGNPVAQAGVAVIASITSGAGGALAGTDTVLTNAGGTATFSNLQVVGPVGSYTLSFGGSGLTGVTASALTLSAGPAAKLGITTQPSTTAQSGVALATQPVVQLQDGAGNPVATAGTTVTAAIASGGGTLGGTLGVSTDAQGVATFTNLVVSGTVGTRTLSFSATGLTGATSGSIVLSAGAAAGLAKSAGDNQSATAGSPLPVDPQVLVTDASGNPVSGVSVTFTVTGGGGTAAAVATTDAAGHASVTWTLGSVAGANSMDATAALTGGTTTVTFNATGTAGSAGQLAILTQPSTTAQSGVVLAQQPVIQLEDALGNPVNTPGVAITASSSGTLGGTTLAVTNSSGVATFTNLSLTGLAGSYQITFTGTNLTGVSSSAITLGAGAATRLVILTQPSTTTPSGVAFVQQPVVQVQDAAGNPVGTTTRQVTAAVNSGPNGTLGAAGRTVSTDLNGVATFQTLTLSGTVGSYTLLFSSAGLSADVSGAIDLTAGAASQMTANSVTSQSATVGTAVAAPPSVLVRDAQGNPVAGVAVTFAVTAGGGSLNGAAATTDAAGLATVASWTLGGVAGTNTVAATATGLSTVTFNATGTAATAANLALNLGNNQSATVNSAVAIAPSVKVTDAGGNAVSGVTVTFAVASGGGSVTSSSPVSNGSGIATLGSWTLGTAAGTNTLTATVTGLTGSPVTFTATGTAGAAATISLSTGDGQSAPVSTAVPVAPAVLVVDGFGNPKSGTSVTFAVTGGGGSVTGGSATTNSSGIATVGSWTLGAAAGSNTLTATSSGLTGSPVTFTATGTAGTATKLVVTVAAPTSAQSGIPFTTQPAVQLQDAGGNPVATAGVTVTATLFLATRVLTNATAVTDAAGLATFSGLTVTGPTGTVDSLNFTATGLTSTPRTALTVTAGTPVKLGVNRQPTTTAQSGVAITTQPRAQVQDSVGNSVSLSGVVVTASIDSGPVGGVLTNPTATTSTTGLATFSGLAISGVPGVYRLRFDATGYTGVVTNNITLSVGPASQLTITTPPPASVASGSAFAPPPVLQLRDAYGNAVPTQGSAITAAVATGPAGSTLSNAVATTDAAGAATFTGITLSGTAGTYTLSFTGTAGTVSSSGFSLTAGGGSKLAMTTQPSATATNGTVFAQQPVVQLQDGSGNPVAVSGVNVTVAVGSGSATLGGTLSATTNGSGTATFTNLKLTGTAGTHTLLFSAPTYTSVSSSSISLVASAATAVAISAGNGQSATVGTAVSTAPAALVTDQSGNPVSGFTVSFAASGSGSVGSPSVATNSSGIASTSWTLSTTAGSNTLTATATGLSNSPLSFTATGTAGAATQLAMLTQPSTSAVNGAAFGTQPAVRLLDAFGNAVATSSVPITATLVGSGGVLGGTATVSTASGVATFSGLSITGTAGTYSLSFASSGLTSVNSGNIALAAGTATTVALSAGDGQSATVGTPLSVAPAVLVTDQSGNPVSGFTVSFAPSGTGGVGSTSVATNSSGIASTSWTLSTTAGANTLTATATGLTNSPITFTATGTAGAATQLAMVTQPSTSAVNGAAFGTQPAVRLLDGFGNVVSTSSVPITASLVGSGGVLGGTATVNTASGVATFSGLSITGTVGSYSLSFTSSGLTGVGSGSIGLTAGTATTVALNAGSGQSATVGTPVSIAPAVLVTDQSGNPVSGFTVSFAPSGDGSVGSTSVATNSSGIASTSWTLATTAGANTLTVTATGLTGSPVGFTATGTAGAATKLTFSSQPTNIASGAVITPAVTVRIEDSFGNLVTSATTGVTLAFGTDPSGGGATLGGTLLQNAVGGVATFSDLTVDAVFTGYTLSATASGLTGATSSSFDVQ